MVKYLYIIIGTVALCGCNVTRNLRTTADMHQVESTHLEAYYSAMLERKLEEYHRRWESSRERRVEITRTVEYDNCLPVDESTGRPPVKRETETRTVIGIDIEMHAMAVTDETGTDIIGARVEINAETEVDAVVSQKERTRRRFPVGISMLFIGTLTVAAGIAFLLINKKKK